jgi:hypothetical protein
MQAAEDKLRNIFQFRLLPFAELERLFYSDDVPMYLDDTPVWIKACREGYPEVFILDFMRHERAQCYGANIRNDMYCYAKTICGFDPVTKEGIPITKLSRDLPDYWEALFIAVVSILKASAVEITGFHSHLVEMISNRTGSYSKKQEILKSHSYATFYNDTPFWLYALRQGAWGWYAALLHHECRKLVTQTNLLYQSHALLLKISQRGLRLRPINDDSCNPFPLDDTQEQQELLACLF